MHTLVLLRHRESVWNRENRFTGWEDVDLTEQGLAQARAAGRALRRAGLDFDAAYASVLRRAVRTLWEALAEMDRMWLPVTHHWRLNERHYGALQGLNKAETAARYGEEQVRLWRRSYDVPPPAMDEAAARQALRQRRYADLAADDAPRGESLRDTAARVLPYWDAEIAPAIRAGRRIVLSAHGNSLRALIKRLDGLADDAIAALEIPNGVPLVYRLDADLRPLRRYYLNEDGSPQVGA